MRKKWKVARFKKLTNTVFNHFLDFLYPRSCVICGSGGSSICPSCEKRLIKKALQRIPCKKCSADLNIDNCSCNKVNFPFKTSFSVFNYDDSLKSIVHAFKYQGLYSYAFKIGKISQAIIPEELVKGVDCIVPVPLHFIRKLKRGYNQAEVLAKGFFKYKTIDNILFRKKITVTQTMLSKVDRKKNLQDAIRVKKRYKNLIKDKVILLVDDVVTTGATVSVCTEVLLNGGAREVRILALARA